MDYSSTSPRVRSRLRSPSRRDRFFCGLLIFSFCYELPLATITPYDRFNPRLFDVVTLIAVFATRWRRNTENRILRAWEILTAIFVFAGVMSYLFLEPRHYGYYSLYFSAQYIEGLLALWILTGFAWEDRHITQLFRVLCFGIIFAGSWGVLQKFGLLSVQRYLPNGELIITQPGIVLATFGITYFNSGVMGAMSATIALALYMKRRIRAVLFWPAFSAGVFLSVFCGSRGALAMIVLLLVILATKKLNYTLAVIGLAIALIAVPGVTRYLQRDSATFQRIESLSQRNSGNTIEARLGANYFAMLEPYWKVHGLSWLAVGCGFYTCPMPDSNGNMKYRVGYGFHNIYFFPLEQAGIAGFLAGLYFWYVVLRTTARRRHDIFGRCAFAISVGIAIIGWTGQIFYFGFGTEHMVIAEVSFLILLLWRQDKKAVPAIHPAKPGVETVPV